MGRLPLKEITPLDIKVNDEGWGIRRKRFQWICQGILGEGTVESDVAECRRNVATNPTLTPNYKRKCSILR